MMTVSWSASDSHTWKGDSVATLRPPAPTDEIGPQVAAVLGVAGEYSGEEIRLTVEELRELATVATALADAKEANRK